jgi:hypothetical protein
MADAQASPAADISPAPLTSISSRHRDPPKTTIMIKWDLESSATPATKAFELSQRLSEKWLTADSFAKRGLLEMICLNFRLDGVSLGFEMRKPFDLLAEGLVLEKQSG